MRFNEQQISALERPVPLLVNAGAGSGKTRVLVERYLRLLLEAPQLSIANVVAITFTNKAAAEMKERIRQRLSEMTLTATEQQHPRLQMLNDQIPYAYISTIHSFCSRMLAEFPFEAGVVPGFNVLEPIETEVILSRIVEKTLDEISRNAEHSLTPDLELLMRFMGSARIHQTMMLLLSDRNAAREWAGQRAGSSPEKILLSWQNIMKSTGLENLEEDKNDHEVARLNASLAKVFLELEAGFEEEKQRLRALDMDDLLIRVHTLLRSDHGEVRTQLSQRFKCILLDEFQDIDPLQWNIIRLLHENSDHPDKVFAVGDPKQSIYSFRRADVRIFHRFRSLLAEGTEPDSCPELTMNLNYRSPKSLTDFVNAVFSGLIGTSDNSNRWEVDYVPVLGTRTNGALDGTVELVITDLPEHTDTFAPAYDAHDFEATALANHLAQLVAGGKISVFEPSAENEEDSERPARYGDIAILLRKRGPLDTMERALREAGIPFQTVAGVGLFFRQELWDIYNILRFLSNPGDDIALVGVLRSPLCKFSDDVLLFLSERKGESYWEKLRSLAQDEDVENGTKQPSNDIPSTLHTSFPGISKSRIAFVVSLLEDLLSIAKRSPLAVLIEDILERTGLVATLSSLPHGTQALANIDKLIDLARSADRFGEPSLRDFVERLEHYVKDGSKEPEAQVLSPETDSVTIMTVHNAKGLEFPVVVLPFLSDSVMRSETESVLWDSDLDIAFTIPDPQDGFVTRISPPIRERVKALRRIKSIAEEKRVFYVAATRARDRLILSAARNLHGKKKTGTNVSRWSWLQDSLSIDDETITEGRIELRYQDSTRTVPVTRYAPSMPFTEQEDAVPSVNRKRLFTFLRSVLNERRECRPSPLPEVMTVESPPETFLIPVTSITEFLRCPMSYYINKAAKIPLEIGTWNTVIGKETPLGKERRFSILKGTVLHAVMEKMDLPSGKGVEKFVNELIESETGISDRQRATLLLTSKNAIGNFKKSALYRQIAKSQNVKREATYTLLLDQRHGIIAKLDVAFMDENGIWQVADFKTGSAKGATDEDIRSQYRIQTASYALAIARTYPEQTGFNVHLYMTDIDRVIRETYERPVLEAYEENLVEQLRKIERFEKSLMNVPSTTYPKAAEICKSCKQTTHQCPSIERILNLDG